MVVKVEPQKSKFDSAIWALVVVLVLAGFTVNYYYSGVALTTRLSVWIVFVIALAGIILQTFGGQLFYRFLKEVRMELRKVVWPTRQETIRMTALVTVVIMIAALLLWGIDSLLLWTVNRLTG